MPAASCWYMSEHVSDQRAENRLSPNAPCSFEALAAAGVFYQHFDPSEVSGEAVFVKPLLEKLHYQHYDVINISPEAMGDKFDDMAKKHFEEHLHEDDEVRLILGGSGYFDIRDINDKWVRIHSTPGDCIVLPAGIYHRFTTGPEKHTQALRLFKENPKWVALSREGEGDKCSARAAYLAAIARPPETTVGTAKGEESGVFSIRYPDTLDDTLTTIASGFLKKVSASGTSSAALVVFVTGSKDPHTGQSWCPHCVAVKETVADGFAALREACGGMAVFVECPVERAAYRGNLDYLYRSHPVLKVQGVPTVLVLTPASHKEAVISGSSDSNCGQNAVRWYDLLDVKVYTNEPTVALMSEL